MPEIPPLPPISSQPISVVLLARDEEPHLQVVLREWLNVLTCLHRDFEIIVVNDGSQDKTLALATDFVLATGFATDQGAVQVISHENAEGIGAALRTGLSAARFPLVFYTTADRAYQPSDLKLLLAEIDKVHLISGYRQIRPVPWFLKGLGFCWRLNLRLLFDLSPEKLPGWLGWREHLYRLVIRAVFAVRTRDMNCAFRLARRHIFARIPIQSNGPFVHTEILIKANFLGCMIGEEIPVKEQPRVNQQGDWTGADYRRLWREGFRIFKHAAFGPPTVDGWPEPKTINESEKSIEKEVACEGSNLVSAPS
jgi:glycosyltransferase involved in cell wall biosynthesis